MADSRGRRKIRRELKEAGLGHVLTPPNLSPSRGYFSWTKSLALLWACIGFLATAITLLSGYPWLELQKDGSLNPRDPFRAMFVAVNQGYLPVTNIQADCRFTFGTNAGIKVRNMNVRSPVSERLWHEDKATIPCMVIGYTDEPFIPRTVFTLPANDRIKNADMTIKITYQLLGIFRRSQAFHIAALNAVDNSYGWEFVD